MFLHMLVSDIVNSWQLVDIFKKKILKDTGLFFLEGGTTDTFV